jgi:hypothetical protein
MRYYQISTSRYENRARPAALYLVTANTESDAIKKLYYLVESENLQPLGYLSRYAIPDYTCGFELFKGE